MGHFNSLKCHHFGYIPVTERIPKIAKHIKLHGVDIETVAGIFWVSTAGKIRLALFAMIGLLTGWSRSILNNPMVIAKYACIHGEILHPNISKALTEISENVTIPDFLGRYTRMLPLDSYG